MRFYKNYFIYFFISAVFLVPGIVALIMFGLRPGIDFTGGTLLTIEASEASGAALLSESNLRENLGEEFGLSNVRESEGEQVILRLKPLGTEEKEALLVDLAEITRVEVISYDSVGAILGGELIFKTLVAIGLACIFLIIYLRVRFKEMAFGWAAFLGVVHDTLIICGIFAIIGAYLGIEVDTLFVTALLTTISFSVHDTVVIYDRVREVRKARPRASLREVCEESVSNTITRSLNNSLVIVFMLAALLLLGGVSLRFFALALLLGVIFGTYSSPFVSVPLMLFFEDAGRIWGRGKVMGEASEKKAGGGKASAKKKGGKKMEKNG